MNVLVSDFGAQQLLGGEKLLALPDAVDGQVHVVLATDPGARPDT